MKCSDRVGRFNYGPRFFRRYQPFFEACKRLPDDAVALVLGANDGLLADPTAQAWRPGWRGYFVEPNPDASRALAASGRGLVVPVAVAAKPGLLRLWTMTPAAATAYERVGAHGSCITSFDREHVASRVRENLAASADPERDVVPIDVPAMTVPQLLDEYRIPRPDLIQVDIEGMESEVVPQCIGLQPRVLLWEHQHAADKDALENEARRSGYQVQRLRNDSLAVRC